MISCLSLELLSGVHQSCCRTHCIAANRSNKQLKQTSHSEKWNITRGIKKGNSKIMNNSQTAHHYSIGVSPLHMDHYNTGESQGPTVSLTAHLNTREWWGVSVIQSEWHIVESLPTEAWWGIWLLNNSESTEPSLGSSVLNDWHTLLA